MLERVILFSVHSVLHVSLYTVPRLLFAVCVRLPRTLWDWVTRRKQPPTYSFERERHIAVVASEREPSAAERLLRLFGLRGDMRYDGPMYSGHIHTILGTARLPRRVAYERELVEADDGNPICLDWLKVPVDGGAAKAKGVLLLIPGLGNYGQTNYIQRFARLCARRGYHCCLLTPRGMGSAPLTTPNITCVVFSSDCNTVLRRCLNKTAIRERFGRDLPLFAVGYSCGGTTMLKSLAEEGEAAARDASLYKEGFPVVAAISMIAPIDMADSARMLTTRMGRLLYAHPIMTALRRYLAKHKKALESAANGLSEEEKAKLPLFHRDFDAAMKLLKAPRDVDVHVVAAHFGYKDEQDYYRHGFGFNFIEKVTVPLMCVNTRDDPICGYKLDLGDWQGMCDRNSRVVYVEYPTGGHFGFVDSPLREYGKIFGPLQTIPLDAMDAFLLHYKND